MAFRLAKSLEILVAQINTQAPGRSTASDGGEPSAEHMARNPTSDHNTGRAYDITNDPAHGVIARRIAEQLVASRDPRIKYIISDAQIVSSKVQPWVWRPYSGDNAHRQHVHVSVMGDPALSEDPRPWAVTLGDAQPTRPGMFKSITATVFGGPTDSMSGSQTAYGSLVAPGWWNRPGVALPARFSERPLPQVRVRHAGLEIVCPVIDVGPWNTNDRYWESGARPQAESGTDASGRQTNRAGIDLTPAAARAIGLPGKGLVDWEFVGIDGEVLPPLKEKDMETDKIVAAVMEALRAQGVIPPAPAPQPVGFDVNQLMPLLQSPVMQKLIGGKAVTILELMPLIPSVMAIMQGRALPALPPPDPVASPVPPPVVAPAVADPTVKPAVATSAWALGIGAVLQALGYVGTPFGIGEAPTTTGTLTTLIPMITGIAGAFGGFGPLINIGLKLFSGFKSK